MEDEQLQEILQEADRRGYDTAQKEELVMWYLKEKEKPQGTNEYLTEKYKPKPKQKGALRQLGESAYSAVVDQLPASFHAMRAASESAIADDENQFVDKLMLESKDSDIGLSYFNTPETNRANAKGYFMKTLGEAEYNRQLEEFKGKYKTSAKEQYGKAKEQQAQGQKRMEGMTTEMSQIKNLGDVIRYGSSAVGEAIGSTIPGIATGGTSVVIQESGPAYLEALDEIAKAMTTQTGEEWTPEQVMELGYDKPATDRANMVGKINSMLEVAGFGSVFGPVAKRLFLKKAAKELLKPSAKVAAKQVLTGALGEGSTEFLQESVTQYETLKAAGHSDEKIFGTDGSTGLFDWGRVAEAGTRGAIGGGFLAGTTSRLSGDGTTKETKRNQVGDESIAKQEVKAVEQRQKVEEKLAEQEGERNAMFDKADAIAAEATDETLNEGTEEDNDEFVNSIKDLITEKERNEEMAKLNEAETEIDEEKAKIVDKALSTQETQKQVISPLRKEVEDLRQNKLPLKFNQNLLS